MLLHLIPRLFVNAAEAHECFLIDFDCSALGLKLRSGIELVARQPYINKRYLVASRKVGRKAMNGFLVETTNPVREFSTITRWAVGADRVISHKVRYVVVDQDMDAVTESVLLWSAMSPGLGGFSKRWPAGTDLIAPCQPSMELVSGDRGGHYVDKVDPSGLIIERSEEFRVPTVERERVLYDSKISIYDRIPTADMAFQACI